MSVIPEFSSDRRDPDAAGSLQQDIADITRVGPNGDRELSATKARSETKTHPLIQSIRSRFGGSTSPTESNQDTDLDKLNDFKKLDLTPDHLPDHIDRQIYQGALNELHTAKQQGTITQAEYNDLLSQLNEDDGRRAVTAGIQINSYYSADNNPNSLQPPLKRVIPNRTPEEKKEIDEKGYLTMEDPKTDQA